MTLLTFLTVVLVVLIVTDLSYKEMIVIKVIEGAVVTVVTFDLVVHIVLSGIV